jgi:hypothetical protein
MRLRRLHPACEGASHQPIARAPNVYGVRKGDETVLFDVTRGKYHTLNEVGTRVWELLAIPTTLSAIIRQICLEYDVEDGTSGRVARDLQQLMDQLERCGVVDARLGHESPRSAPTGVAPDRHPSDRAATQVSDATADAGPLPVPSVFTCGLWIVAVRISLKALGFGATTRWVQRRTAPAPQIAVSIDALRSIEYNVALAAALYPGRAQCLERSLVLYYLLRRRGVPITVRFGVQPHPFAAHAWVEFDGAPLNDIPEHVKQYSPFPGSLS